MPGAFAHMTMVLTAKNLKKLEDLSSTAHRAISGLTKYAELGSVSPDYPYLSLLDGATDEWADLMHYECTGDMIREGARILRDYPDGVVKRQCLAWLMGYAAHVVTDVSIHPVVKLKVGDYQGHEKEHRVCEMHQDAFIYQTLNVGDITDTEHLKGGICACGTDDALDLDIKALWLGMLKAVHPEVFSRNPPDIDKWHRNFKRVVDGVADEGGWLPGFVMRFIAGQGFLYFAAEVVDDQFIKNLDVPGGGKMDYEQIFQKAAENVADVWLEISRFVEHGVEIAKVQNWNLDTGANLTTGDITFWG
ncbi:zinc dependent phospholipase C family protein [Geopsychrobacter electrodiphilus]|uniref:zinc dependent phospholipase C family protein n=1 Tax=Geopsychrobacter electrodiphilus TaxID=225196 RepID=UPI000370BBE3|nr:zinc dependent phospholipase C family protein [Geopsychrobacter electrodiphilus]